MAHEATAVRQGDVLLLPLSPNQSVSGTPIAPKGRRYILAEGEQTGHHHSVSATQNVAFMTDGVRTFLSVSDRSVKLTHQEHAALEIVPGDYEVVQQRVSMPGSARVVRVLD